MASPLNIRVMTLMSIVTESRESGRSEESPSYLELAQRAPSEELGTRNWPGVSFL